MRERPDMIPKADCLGRRLYRIQSRNLLFGVYKPETGGFLGIRTKFGHRYVFEEYHWENEYFATVQPFELLSETLPEEIVLDEYLGNVCSCGTPAEYRKWSEGGERTTTISDDHIMTVPGEWVHLAETTCKNVRASSMKNEPLFKWLLNIEKKYGRPIG